VCITWGIFHATLHAHQVIAAIVLIAAVAMVHHVQQQIEASLPAGRECCNNARELLRSSKKILFREERKID